MASSYINDLRLNEMATGDASGTWGTVTNTNLELIGESLGFGTEAIQTNANTHTSTIADGATDPARAMYIKYTGTLDSACTITIGPNTINRMHFIENATSGAQNIIIFQGTGSTVTIPNGDTKAVYLNGAASGAAVVDAFASLSVVDLKVQDDLTVTDDLIVNGDIDLEGSIDVNGTTNLDVVDVDGAVNFAADVTFADGADIITASAGTSNVRIGVNAGDAIASGGNFNVVIGDEAGTALTTGDKNVAIGFEALKTEDANGGNTAIGYRALKVQDGGAEVENTAIGSQAGQAIDLGRENVLVGANVGDALTHADFNVAIGNSSLGADTLGHKSTAVGYATLNAQNFTSSTDSFNTAVGYFAGVSVTTGNENTLIGGLAGDAMTDSDRNTAVGYLALTTNTKSDRNTAIGRSALENLNHTSVTSGLNTAIGHGSGSVITTGTKNTIIGSYSGNSGGLDIRTLSNRIVLSDGDGTIRLYIDNEGNVLLGTTTTSMATEGTVFYGTGSEGVAQFSSTNMTALYVNRSNDGTLVDFRSAASSEGTISISGTTTSYNGGHLSRWSRLLDNSKDTSIVKGTVMTNLDEMVEWGDEDNEQLNKMAVSSVEGVANVAGVFVNWDNDDDWSDMNVAMTGDMVIRIAQGVTVARGDLLMSAGDGTAKTQDDDIVRSKTIAKVTSTNVSHTYDDGTYLVPCVLMAC